MFAHFVTVKIAGLVVAVPPGVVTEIGPLFVPFDIVAARTVDETTVNFTLEPPTFTAVVAKPLPEKFVPVIVTVVPPGPPVGVNAVIDGEGMTVNVPLVAVPPGVVTAIGPVVAPPGTVATIWVPFIWNAAGTPLNRTLVVLPRLTPFTVIGVPTPPLAGERLVMTGAGPVVTVKALPLTAIPSGVVTDIVPLVAPTGTVAVICVAESTTYPAFVPLNCTVVAPAKFVPAIATDMPAAPLVGENAVMVGPGRGT